MSAKKFRGIYPILGTAFLEDERIDYDSQEKLIDFCINNGSHGLVTLANASEGHLMSDEERKELLTFVIKKVNGRMPVIVTVNHPSSYCAAAMAKFAEEEGADGVMCMPPFFGRWRAGLAEIEAYFLAIDEAVSVPMVIQDHQLSDISMPVDFMLRVAKKSKNIKYLKLEFGNIIHKARKILAHPDCTLDGVFGGNSGVFLPEEFEAGCTGTMPACYMPAQFRAAWDLLEAGKLEEATEQFQPFSRIAAYEKDVANRCLWKEILVKNGVLKSAHIRRPLPSFFEDADVSQLLRLAEGAGLIKGK